MSYFLLKSEPTCYSIDDLARDGQTSWTGVRNYQARNTLRDAMNIGDLCLFYHSNCCQETAVVGIMRVTSEALPDMTALDIDDEHFDSKSTLENPIWITRIMEFVEKFPHPVTLTTIKSNSRLSTMTVAQRGSRLSITPVSEAQFKAIVEMGK